MAILKLPVQDATANYAFTAPLDEVRYRFAMRFNSRDLHWYMDIQQEDGTQIRTGVRLVTGGVPNARIPQRVRPAGALYIQRNDNLGDDPVLDSFIRDVSILYLDAEELANA